MSQIHIEEGEVIVMENAPHPHSAVSFMGKHDRENYGMNTSKQPPRVAVDKTTHMAELNKGLRISKTKTGIMTGFSEVAYDWKSWVSDNRVKL